MEKELCEHKWETIEQEKRVKEIVRGGIFTDGYIAYEMSILQKCSKCGKLNSIKH